MGSRASVGGGIVGVPPHRDLIYLTTGFRVPRGMQNNGDSRLLQQFFIRKIISVKVGSPRDIEIVQISGKITPVGFNLSCMEKERKRTKEEKGIAHRGARTPDH